MIQRRKLPIERRPVPRLDVEWKGVFENYSKKWVFKNFWRVEHYLGSKEDALQECAMIWVRCRNRYQMTVDNPAWFMSLFQRAVSNDWNTMAQRDGRMRSLDIVEYEEQLDYPEGFLTAAINKASPELQRVLNVMSNAPEESLEIMLGSSCLEITNQRIKRLCGITSEVDVLAELHDILA